MEQPSSVTYHSSGVEMSRIPIKDSYWFADTQYAPKKRFATMNQRTVLNESEQSTYSAYYLMLGKYRTTIKDELEDCPELPPGLGKRRSFYFVAVVAA